MPHADSYERTMLGDEVLPELGCSFHRGHTHTHDVLLACCRCQVWANFSSGHAEQPGSAAVCDRAGEVAVRAFGAAAYVRQLERGGCQVDRLDESGGGWQGTEVGSVQLGTARGKDRTTNSCEDVPPSGPQIL